MIKYPVPTRKLRPLARLQKLKRHRSKPQLYFDNGEPMYAETSTITPLTVGRVANSFVDFDKFQFFCDWNLTEDGPLSHFKENLQPAAGLNLFEKIPAIFPYCYSLSDDEGIIFYVETASYGTVRVEADPYSQHWAFRYWGSKEGIEVVRRMVAALNLKPNPQSVEWCFGDSYQNMDTLSMTLVRKPTIAGSFPWLGRSVEQFTQDYMNSPASVLILIGPPGTGKTSLLREMMALMGGSIRLTYDAALLNSDGFFASFIGIDGQATLVMEDADLLISARTEGNDLMAKLLNISDGLVAVQNKKIIFTTNLPNTNNIDPALLRQGRCFEVVRSRYLTPQEAQVVRENFKPGTALPNPGQASYSLGEITR